VFVKNVNGTAEDDGYLLSYVYQPEIDQSEVLILNAQDMQGDPVARIQLPVRVPAGFHGNWMAN
jgi:carotenoid cleavage dioxygenase